MPRWGFHPNPWHPGQSLQRRHWRPGSWWLTRHKGNSRRKQKSSPSNGEPVFEGYQTLGDEHIIYIYIYVYIYIWGMKLKYGTSDARTMEQCDSVQLRWVAVATKHQEVRPLIQPWIDRRHLLRCTWYANVATATAFVTFPVQISELTLSGALDLASFDKSMEHLLTTGTQLKCVEESSMNTPTNTCLIFWSWINAQNYLNNNHPFWEPHNFEPYSSCRSAIILPFPHPRYYISSWCWLYPHCITILVGWGYLSPHF